MRTEFRISIAQAKKVLAPLPVPTICPNCGTSVSLVNNLEIFGREMGDWPFAYRCSDTKCNSYVGIHKRTDIPLGTLADATTRFSRSKAKAAFMPLWTIFGFDRHAAYRWLGEKLGIHDVRHVHIAWFNKAQCERVIKICEEYRSIRK